MLHRLFTIASTVSLALCIGVLMLWARGHRLPVRYWRQTFNSRNAVYGQDSIDNMQGVLAILYGRGKVLDEGERGMLQRQGRTPGYSRWHTLPWMAIPSSQNAFERAGFYFRVQHLQLLSVFDPNSAVYYVGAPHWALAVLFALLPVVWLIRITRRIGRACRGRCRVCGYDLRASPDRCPECGAVVRGAARTAHHGVSSV